MQRRAKLRGEPKRMRVWQQKTTCRKNPGVAKVPTVVQCQPGLPRCRLTTCSAQWLRGRASDSRLRELGFESCAAVLKPWARFFILYCSSSLSCINEYLAIDSGGYVYEQSSRINWMLHREAEMVSE